MQRDNCKIIKDSNERLIKEVLPIIDDIENAIEKTKDKESKRGFEMIHDNLLKVLEKNDVRPIDTSKKKFDPYYHEVLMKEKSDKEDEIILEEIQKGYMLNDKVIRHSKVKISG